MLINGFYGVPRAGGEVATGGEAATGEGLIKANQFGEAHRKNAHPGWSNLEIRAVMSASSSMKDGRRVELVAPIRYRPLGKLAACR